MSDWKKRRTKEISIKEIARIMQEESAVFNEWVSVNERLPEKDGKYMVWRKDDFEICEFDAESQTFGYTYDEYDEMYSRLVCWDDGINKKVTHWMPLPEPPKEN